MEEANLNNDLENLKRTVDENKSLLNQHCKLFFDALIQIEEISRKAYSTKDCITAALDRLKEESDEVSAQQVLVECQALVDPLRKSLSKNITECSHQMLEIRTATITMEAVERMIKELSTKPDTTYSKSCC